MARSCAPLDGLLRPCSPPLTNGPQPLACPFPSLGGRKGSSCPSHPSQGACSPSLQVASSGWAASAASGQGPCRFWVPSRTWMVLCRLSVPSAAACHPWASSQAACHPSAPSEAPFEPSAPSAALRCPGALLEAAYRSSAASAVPSLSRCLSAPSGVDDPPLPAAAALKGPLGGGFEGPPGFPELLAAPLGGFGFRLHVFWVRGRRQRIVDVLLAALLLTALLPFVGLHLS